MAQAKRGERIGTKPPYGYQKSFESPKQIVPNEDTAPIVKRIFALCASGLGPSKIARILREEQVITPTVYDYHTSGTSHAHLNEHKPYNWSGKTVGCILEREEYHGHKEDCTPHTIKVMALHQIALAEIRRVTQDAKLHTDIFLAREMDKHQSGLKKELSAKMRECEKGTKRLADLDKLFRKAFEEMTLEHLSNQQFQMLTQGYEAEKQDLSQRVALLEREISSSQDKMLNSDRFLKLVEKYTDIQELTPELVREFIDKIVVHERSEPWKKKNYTQQVDVYFNFVGRV